MAAIGSNGHNGAQAHRETLLDLICEASMVAAAETVTRIAHPAKEPDMDEVVGHLRALIQERYPVILKETKEAMEAHMGLAIVRQILSVHCTEIGLEAVKRAGLIREEDLGRWPKRTGTD